MLQRLLQLRLIREEAHLGEVLHSLEVVEVTVVQASKDFKEISFRSMDSTRETPSIFPSAASFIWTYTGG